MKIIKTIISTTALTLLFGCAAVPSKPPQKTSLEIQAVQAKFFETNMATAFRSSVSVLQDLGYIIQSASLDTGFISAQSPTRGESKSGWEILNVLLGGAASDTRKERKVYVTASVESFGEGRSRVRFNFVRKVFRSGAYGQQATDEWPIHDPKLYESVFEKVGEAIFIRTAQR